MTDIKFAVGDTTLPGYLSEPAGPGPWPGIVVIHDALGLSSDVKRICDRMAGAGYLTLAPALYRHGNRIRCVVSTLRAVQAGAGVAFDDIVSARDHLVADPRCTGKVGIVGFCMGGGFALQLAPRGFFDAAAPNYGIWPEDTDVLRASCPTVASYGAKDRMLPGVAAKHEQLLTDAGIPHDVKEYPEVGHSFMNEFGTPGPLQFVERIAGLAYSEPEAEDAFARILAFFGEHLR